MATKVHSVPRHWKTKKKEIFTPFRNVLLNTACIYTGTLKEGSRLLFSKGYFTLIMRIQIRLTQAHLNNHFKGIFDYHWPILSARKQNIDWDIFHLKSQWWFWTWTPLIFITSKYLIIYTDVPRWMGLLFQEGTLQTWTIWKTFPLAATAAKGKQKKAADTPR